MAKCRNKDLKRKTKKHPSGKISAKQCAAGKRLQALPAVKAWSQALKDEKIFKKGSFNKLPKRGTAAHNKLVKRQQEIMNAAPRRSSRIRKQAKY